MKEDPKELTYKKYVQLVKRRNEIWKLQRGLPWRDLKEPIQDGWILRVELSEEALRRKDAPGMATATILATENGDFVTRDSKKISLVRKNNRYLDLIPLFTEDWKDWKGNIIRTYRGPHFNSITEKAFKKITEPSVAKWFTRMETTRVLKWNGQTIIDVKYVLNIREHYFVVKVKKRMITALRDINPALEKEMKEVEDALQPYYRSLGGYHRDIKDHPKYARKHVKAALNRVKKGELEDVMKDHKVGKLKRGL